MQLNSHTESTDVRNDVYFYCQKPGHLKKDCPALNKLKSVDSKDRRNFKRGQKAMISEERRKIQLELDALDIDSESDDEDSYNKDSDTFAHDIIDLGQKKKEVCGIAEDQYNDIANVENCLTADETTNISRFVNYGSDAEGINDLEHLKRELDFYEKEFYECSIKS